MEVYLLLQGNPDLKVGSTSPLDLHTNHIEEALSSVLDSKIRIQGCSRTDAGVHARGQCFHFDATWPHTSEKLIRAIHSKLDKDSY